MRLAGKIAAVLALLVVLVLSAAAVWLAVAPPDLLRLATGYAAKITCSNAFVAGRDPQEVLALDVQAPGHPLLRFVSVDSDPVARTTKTRIFGFFAPSLAIHREGMGCTSVPDGDAAAAALPPVAPLPPRQDETAAWPEGDDVEPSDDRRLAAVLDDPALVGPGMRAVVVVHRGRIVGERYADGFDASTPLLGWSMTKTISAALVGTLVRDGRLSLDEDGLLPIWSGDERRNIRLADLMSMSSGLTFNEDYGDIADITRMLYLTSDMAAFASGMDLAAPIGTIFNYSSGTSVLVSRIWQDRFQEPSEALAWPGRALFAPLGMSSAVFEADARGTFVGSSYLYATARDWARFGQFLLQDGVWAGRRLLPDGYVAWMRAPSPAPGGHYGQGHVWLRGPSAGTPQGEDPDQGFDLPEDAFWMLGHDGQSTAVVPSRDLVVVRLGLTPSRLGYKSQRLVEALLDVLP